MRDDNTRFAKLKSSYYVNLTLNASGYKTNKCLSESILLFQTGILLIYREMLIKPPKPYGLILAPPKARPLLRFAG